MDWLNFPVFIIGYPKSGTSLLNAILDNHPQLVVLPEESNFINTLYVNCKKIQGKSRLTKKEVNLIIGALEKSRLRLLVKGKVEKEIGGNFDYSSFDYPSFISYIEKQLYKIEIVPENVFKLIVESFYLSSDLSYANDIQHWVEKTPYNKFFLENRKNLYKKMFASRYKIIHIMRDPRDNYIAYKRKHTSLTVSEFAMGWKRVINLIEEYTNDINHLLIRYEDLVKETDQTVEKIRVFLNIKPNETLLQPSKYGTVWFGNSMFNKKTANITANNTARYVSYPDKKSIQQIEYLLSQKMSFYNYSIVNTGLKFTSKLRFLFGISVARLRYKLKFIWLNFLRFIFIHFWKVKD